MKKTIFFITLIFIMTLNTGCYILFEPVTGSDYIIPVELYNIPDGFTGVKTDNSIDVQIIYSATYDVQITANDNLVKYLIVQKEGSDLRIGLESLGISYSNIRIMATVYTPVLTDVSASTSAKVRLTDFDNLYNLNANVSTSAEITGTVYVENDLTIEASTSGIMDLAGTTDYLSVVANTSSRIDLEYLSARNAYTTLSTSAVADVNVYGILDVDISTSSVLNYSGGPDLGIVEIASGASMINKDY